MSQAEDAYREALGRFGRVVDFDISGLDRLGVPVTSCSLAVEGILRHHGNGYAGTAEGARVSGLGELAEGVLSAQRLRDLEPAAQTETRTAIITRHGADRVADPRELCLPAGSGYDDDQRLTWLQAERVRDGETVWVPLDFVASEPGESALDRGRPMIVSITNGLGAGLDRERAISHGIGEILQRHMNGLRFRALDRRSPVLASAGLPESVAGLLDRFADAGIEVVIKYAGTAHGAFSCYAMGLDAETTDPIRLTGCGEAADPSPEAAMIKAVLEYANSRVRKAFCFGADPRIATTAPAAYWAGLRSGGGEPRAVEAMRAWARLPAERLRELTAPDLSQTVALDEIVPAGSEHPADLGGRLDHLDGHDVLTVAGRTGDAWSAKTLITGLEVEILSYGRIGEAGVRESLEADLGLVRVQDGPSGEHTARVCLTADAEDRLGGPAWYSYARAAEIVGTLYPLYREPPRHSVSVTGVAQAREGSG